jgi:hypothetical protein
VSGIGQNQVGNVKLILTQSVDPGTGTVGVYEGSNNNWTENSLSDTNKPISAINIGTLSSTFDNENIHEIPLSGIT